jgi:hypothetical protein
MEPPSPVENDARASNDVIWTLRTERVFKAQRAQLKCQQTLQFQKAFIHSLRLEKQSEKYYQHTAQTAEEARKVTEEARAEPEQMRVANEKLLREQYSTTSRAIAAT